MLDKTDGRVLAGDWTTERVKLLETRWAEGLSAAAIAYELGGVTRSAVIGKIHRCGFQAPPEKAAMTANRPQRKPGWKPVVWKPPMSQEERAQRQAAKMLQTLTRPQPRRHEYLNLTFDQLAYGDCRFPIGDRPPFLYCGHPTVNLSSWCQHCFEVTHAPPKRREAA